MELKHSFRSSDAVLRLVDRCFDTTQGSGGLGGAPEHLAFFDDKPGRVDLWPPVPKPDKQDDEPWFSPLDRAAQSNPEVVLARQIAGEIRAMIDRGEQIVERGESRPVHEGDFLILVRRRKLLFNALIRACKAQGLEVAGADRLVLGEELAVQDLIALLKFLALPEDDLSLAVALRSPLLGWSEDQLFRLAHGRQGRYLWDRLRTDYAGTETLSLLNDLRGQVDFLRPYELIERILTRHDGRRRIRARFGAEVDEALEAFVDLALMYEQDHIPSLDGFLGWLAASDAEVKRQSESAGRRIRVMTVHGSKGLEAPIVILPDTAARRAPNAGPVVSAEGVPILRVLADAAPEVQTNAGEAEKVLRDEENDRLLYVALTRAESWLIVAAAGSVEGSWYERVAAGMAGMPTVPLATPQGDGLRFQHGDWPALAGAPARGGPRAEACVTLPPLPRLVEEPGVLSPTALGGAKALPGAGDETEVAMARGTRVHRLLEVLPGVAPAQRAARGAALLQALGDADGALLDEVLCTLSDPALMPVFADEALVEVALSGTWQGRSLWGIVDRLLIDDERVLAVDFKTNRVVPADAGSVPEGLLRQMGAYAHLLAALYPGRRIETALLWTAEARLMTLDPAQVGAALGRAAAELATLDPAGTSS
jgi:ATP-dependent helicase/nuclease subunit A